jgi:hypothetical protein
MELVVKVDSIVELEQCLVVLLVYENRLRRSLLCSRRRGSNAARGDLVRHKLDWPFSLGGNIHFTS